MTIGDRLRSFLPPFLRPGPALSAILDAAARGLAELSATARLLRARGAAQRVEGEFEEYYASERRKDDIARLAQGLLLSKRQNETWEEFEVRVREFRGLEGWDGTKQRYTVTGDVARWGCFEGIKREIERTGLLVEDIYAGAFPPDEWKVYDTAGEPADPLQRSKMYDLEHEPPAGQRTTKVYSLGQDWVFYVRLVQPEIPVEYSVEEVKEIIKLTKPAWTMGKVLFPDSQYWVRVV